MITSTLFNIKITCCSLEDLVAHFPDLLKQPKLSRIVTLNPQIVIGCKNDTPLKDTRL